MRIVTPVEFGGRILGDDISCSLCGGDPVGESYPYQQGAQELPIGIPIGPGVQDVEVYGIGISFSVSYGPVSLTVEPWKEVTQGTASERPRLKVDVTTWYKQYLVKFDDNTKWKICTGPGKVQRAERTL